VCGLMLSNERRIATFDVSVTVHHRYNEINNQLDATITVY